MQISRQIRSLSGKIDLMDNLPGSQGGQAHQPILFDQVIDLAYLMEIPLQTELVYSHRANQHRYRGFLNHRLQRLCNPSGPESSFI